MHLYAAQTVKIINIIIVVINIIVILLMDQLIEIIYLLPTNSIAQNDNAIIASFLAAA